MAGDNGIAKLDAATGTIQIGEAQLDDSGNITPTTDGNSSLGTTSPALGWANLALSSLGSINWDSGDVTLTHSANGLTFGGATNGYKFDNGPVLLDILTATPTSPIGYTAVYGDNYYNSRPNPVMVQNGDSSTNQLQRNLWGPLGNALLHSGQTINQGVGMRIRQANFFFLTANAAVNDTFTITDGTTTETWTAVAGAPGAFQFDQSGTLAQTLESLATQIAANSTRWEGVWYGQSLNNIHTGATGGGVVIIRQNPLLAGADRLYGTFATASTARTFDFSGDVDYRRVDLANEDIQLPSTDPAAKTFGFNTTSSDAVKQGDTYVGILDNTLWSCNKFYGLWSQLGGGPLLVRAPSYIGAQLTGATVSLPEGQRAGAVVTARNESTAQGIHAISAQFASKTTIATTDYFLSCYRGSVRMGGVRGNGDSTTVVYEAFSGGHIGQTPMSSIDMGTGEIDDGSQVWEPGMILVGTGMMCSNPDEGIVNYQPQVALSSSANQATVVGVYNGASMDEWSGCNPNMPISNYAALGRGRVLVTDESGDVDNGDLIVTSSTSGYGMKQADDVMRSTTVAKCIQQVDWASITDTINGHKYALVACFIYCG